MGSLTRVAISVGWLTFAGTMPWLATLSVNVLGGLGAGLTLAWLERGGHALWGNFLIMGVLGGFTTFSAFTLQLLDALRNGHWLFAFGYTTASLLVPLVAAGTGYALLMRN